MMWANRAKRQSMDANGMRLAQQDGIETVKIIRRWARPVIVGCVILSALAGCGDDGQPPTNVLLITIDTTRADHLSVLGYERDTTPYLEAFAAQGTSFTTAYSPTSTTGPTHSTIMTSLYPAAHRVVKNGLTLSEDFTTIAEHLKSAGYETGAIVSAFVLSGKFGYAQGFDTYYDTFLMDESTHERPNWEGRTVEGGFDRRADFTTARAQEWLANRSHPDQPFFLWIHYFDPHDPYTPPEPYASRFARESSAGRTRREMIDRYDAEIAFTDDQIGVLFTSLAQAGLNDNTLVVVAADHGEGLGQHGYYRHGVDVYEEAVRVPLLFRWPGQIPAGRTLNAPVGLIDLAPTICELVGAELNLSDVQGTSLASVLYNPTEPEPDRPVFLYRRHRERVETRVGTLAGELFGVRVGDWKFIRGDEQQVTELFNLAQDPKERNNVYTQFPKEAAALSKLVAEWRQSSASGRPVLDNMSDEDTERLRSMGYVK